MGDTNSCTSSRARSRKSRVFVFHDFLTSTYEIDYLRDGVVLDVAGGKGDLSWLLRNLHQVDSVVADPRPTSDRHWIRSVQYLRLHPEEVVRRSVPNLASYQPLASILGRLPASLHSPRHLRLLVNEDLVEALSFYIASGDFEKWSSFFRRALVTGARSNPLFGSSSQSKSAPHSGILLPGRTTPSDVVRDRNEDDPRNRGSVQDAQEALSLLLNVRLVVGFHPDQAVDYCLELAALLNVPFCVVPCCVFPREFPHRRLLREDGGAEPVRTYSQLIEYLLQKAPCRVGRLRFYEDPESPLPSSSRSTVLFSLPEMIPRCVNDSSNTSCGHYPMQKRAQGWRLDHYLEDQPCALDERTD